VSKGLKVILFASQTPLFETKLELVNKAELKTKLDSPGINENFYSLDGQLLPGRLVLYHSYENWNVFYFDERGNRNDEVTFQSENEACQYIYEVIGKRELK
jgi:hypothetical protein